jgi:hypothetical protein
MPNRAIIHNPARTQLVEQVLNARIVEDVVAAREALHGWLAVYPDDWGARYAFDHLHRLEQSLELIAAGREN